MDCRCNVVLGQGALAAYEEHRRGLHSAKSLRVESVVIHNLALAGNRVRGGDTLGPCGRRSNECNFVFWKLEHVAQKNQEGFLFFPCVQEGLHAHGGLCREVPPTNSHGRFVEDETTDIRGQKHGFQRAKSPKGMPQHIHGAPDRVNHGGNIFSLALVRIGWRIAAVATPTSVNGPHAKVALKRWPHQRPRGMVAHRAMHKEQRLPRATSPASDGCSILRTYNLHNSPSLGHLNECYKVAHYRKRCTQATNWYAFMIAPPQSRIPSMSINRCCGPRNNAFLRYGGGSTTNRGFSTRRRKTSTAVLTSSRAS